MTGVLVTGATTRLGHALVQSLLSEERPVLAVGAEPKWPFGPDQRLHYVCVDLTRSRSLRGMLFGTARDLGVTAVVDCAHHRSVRARGRRAHRLNVESTRELLHLAERHPTIERYVYRSDAEVYLVDSRTPGLIAEDHPLDLVPGRPQRVRDRVETDLTVCTRMGMSDLHLVVLRLAELLAPDNGSQLWDYLSSPVCLRPMGYDPMVNVISVEDAVRALRLALDTPHQGVFNVPGRDTLPLSAAIEAWGRTEVAVPGPALRPLYALRSIVTRRQFDWKMNRERFHFSCILDGRRAERDLGYEPAHEVDWPELPERYVPV